MVGIAYRPILNEAKKRRRSTPEAKNSINPSIIPRGRYSRHSRSKRLHNPSHYLNGKALHYSRRA